MDAKNDKVDEVSDEIDAALKDIKGIGAHRKRLAFCLSLGICQLPKSYLKKQNALKPGNTINHQWLKKKKDNVLKILSDRLVTPIEKLPKLNKILDIAYKIENKRNDLVYGYIAKDDTLQELIDDYLKIKKEVDDD